MQCFGYERTAVPPAALVVAGAQIGELFDRLSLRICRLPRMWYYWVRPTELAAEEAWIDALA